MVLPGPFLNTRFRFFLQLNLPVKRLDELELEKSILEADVQVVDTVRTE
jgi:hypothetical protein